MCAAGLNMGTITGRTHINMTFSFWTASGKHFIGNALCSSDDSVTQLIHIFHSSTISNVFYKPPEEKIQRSRIWRGGGDGNGSPSEHFLDMMENTVLRHVFVETMFQLDGAPPHFSHRVRAFLDKEFPYYWIK
jgi:hypothetical protein